MNLEFQIPEIVFQPQELNAKSRAIHERAIKRAQTYLVAETDVLESIIEVDQDKTYEKLGLQFLTTYCVKHMGIDETVAGVLVRVARKSQAVPQLGKAVTTGEISISNARTISCVITNENQAEWIEKAKTLSKNKLEREISRIAPDQARPQKARFIGNGRVQIVVELSEEEYDRRCKIKNLVSQSIGKTATESEIEVAMMDCYEFHKDPIRKAERAAARKEKRAAVRECKETAASQDVSLGSESSETPKPTPDIPAHVKHAVNLRDHRQCQAQHPDGTKCLDSRWIQYHHILERSRGGLDVLENIITLCSAHHRLWHKLRSEAEVLQN